jgi:hypothetical protein
MAGRWSDAAASPRWGEGGMTLVEELVGHIRDTVVPDKARILRTRELAAALARRIPDRGAARALEQRLNSAYLVLQLATLSEDPAMAQGCRRDCAALVLALARAARAAQDAGAAPGCGEADPDGDVPEREPSPVGNAARG